MSSPSNPSAGTARPDAAPSEFMWAWSLLKDLRLELSADGERAIDVILAAIDERDAVLAERDADVLDQKDAYDELRSTVQHLLYLEMVDHRDVEPSVYEQAQRELDEVRRKLSDMVTDEPDGAEY